MQQEDERKRILFVGRSTWSEHGGIQRFNRRVVAGLEQLSAAVEVLMVADAPSQVPKSPRANRYVGFSGSILKFALAFMQCGLKSDVLLLGHINFLPFAALYKILRPGGKVILFAHGVEVWNDPRYRRARFYEPWVLHKFVNQVAVVSNYSKNLMAEAFGLSGSCFSLFPNAISIPAQCPPMDRAGANILVVSRLAVSEAEKHVDKVILALAQVRKAVPDARLVIIGDGGLRPELEVLARQLDVSEHVDFAGFVDDASLQKAYRNARVFVLPSSKEGFGIVYLEAWAKGLPVVGSRFGAAPEVISDGIDGFTVDPAHPSELAERIIRLLIDRDLALSFARAGWRKLRVHFSDEAFRERIALICGLDFGSVQGDENASQVLARILKS